MDEIETRSGSKRTRESGGGTYGNVRIKQNEGVEYRTPLFYRKTKVKTVND